MAAVVFCLLLVLAGRGAAGAVDDSPSPIQVIADRMESDPQCDCLRFVGHVEAKQGDLTILADDMTVFYSGDQGASAAESQGGRQVRKLKARGSVKITRGDWIATGQAMDYAAGEKKVLLTGDAKVWQGENLVEGENIELDLEGGKTVVERSSTERVKAFIYPEKGD